MCQHGGGGQFKAKIQHLHSSFMTARFNSAIHVLEYLLLEMNLRFSILESQRVQYMQNMQGTDDI